jgi:hypothetical protein
MRLEQATGRVYSMRISSATWYGDNPDFSTAMGTLNTVAGHFKKVPA